MWVLLNQSNAIAVFDARTRVHVATIATTSAPLGLAVEPNGERVFVSLQRQDRVVAYDAGTRAIRTHFETGLEPDGLARVC